YRYHTVAVLLVVVALAYPVSLSFFDRHNSPAVVVCFALFLLVAGYGLVAYPTRQAVPFLIGPLLLLLVRGGLPPHQFRFGGLPGYNPDFPGGPEEKTKLSPEDVAFLRDQCAVPEEKMPGGVLRETILDLTRHARLDADRQRRFDQLLLAEKPDHDKL